MDTPTIPHDYPDCLKASAVPEAAEIPLDALRTVDGSLPEHSDTGPSSADRIIRCPGSLRLTRWLRDQGVSEGESEDASRGTKLHAVTAGMLATGDTAGLNALDAEDQEAVETVLSAVLDQLQETGLAGDPALVELIEDRIDLSDCGAGHGTIDYGAAIPGEHGMVADAKFGARAVSHPRHNWQMILYGHGLCRALGLARVRLVIVRPSAELEWQVMTWDTTAEQLAELASAYKAAVFTAMGKEAPLVVGETQCLFCAAKKVCPARWACAAQVPRHGSWSALAETATPEELRGAYERAKIAASQFGALAASLAEAAIAHPDRVRIAGYVVEQGTGRRIWRAADLAAPELEKLAKGKGKDLDALWSPRALISPAQAEKVLGKAAAVKAVIDPLITTTPGKPALKKES